MLLVKECQLVGLLSLKMLILQLVYLDLVKIRLEEIMPGDLPEKKDTFLTITKQNVLKPKKWPFRKKLTHAFGKKMPIIFFTYN